MENKKKKRRAARFFIESAHAFVYYFYIESDVVMIAFDLDPNIVRVFFSFFLKELLKEKKNREKGVRIS